MTAGHFIFIPAVLLVGIVIGWILGSRAARDAYAMELRRREEAQAENGRLERRVLHPPTGRERRLASTSGSPASRTFCWAISTGYATRKSSTRRRLVSTIA